MQPGFLTNPGKGGNIGRIRLDIKAGVSLNSTDQVTNHLLSNQLRLWFLFLSVAIYLSLVTLTHNPLSVTMSHYYHLSVWPLSPFRSVALHRLHLLVCISSIFSLLIRTVNPSFNHFGSQSRSISPLLSLFLYHDLYSTLSFFYTISFVISFSIKVSVASLFFLRL